MFITPPTLAGFLLFWLCEKENIVIVRVVAGGFLCYFYCAKRQNKSARRQGPTKTGTKGAYSKQDGGAKPYH